MSQVDHFIEEVTEEVRRDKLYAFLRRYGWIAVLAVLLIVGGAAFIEWRKARERAAAEALGDAVLAALEAGDEQALAQVSAEGDGAMVLTLLKAGEGRPGEDDLAALRALAANDSAPAIYRDLAALKLVMTGGLAPDERRALVEPLLAPGAPYRVLAEEQMALVELESGEEAAALARLQAILSDDGATQALRRRAAQLIVAMGGEPEN